jgi:hypothetical protein
MAGQFLDDFQGYGGNAALMLNGKYAEVSTPLRLQDPDPTVAGSFLRHQRRQRSVRRVLSSAQTTVGIAYRIWIEQIFGESVHFHGAGHERGRTFS